MDSRADGEWIWQRHRFNDGRPEYYQRSTDGNRDDRGQTIRDHRGCAGARSVTNTDTKPVAQPLAGSFTGSFARAIAGSFAVPKPAASAAAAVVHLQHQAE
jgi:hypothetical protein